MKFMADDGKVFDTIVECKKYEKRCEIDRDIFFFKVDETNLIKTVDPLHADYVVVEKEFDLELLEELFGNFCDGLDNGVGTYYWETDEGKWIKICLKIRELENEIEIIQNRINAYESIEDAIYEKIKWDKFIKKQQ